eukprot:12101209-Alexandrium_andersonii.AAC.1
MLGKSRRGHARSVERPHACRSTPEAPAILWETWGDAWKAPYRPARRFVIPEHCGIMRASSTDPVGYHGHVGGALHQKYLKCRTSSCCRMGLACSGCRARGLLGIRRFGRLRSCRPHRSGICSFCESK